MTKEQIEDKLKELVLYYDKEDRTTRGRQLKLWRKLKLLWEDFHRTWYSEVAHDWRVFDLETTADSTQQSFYDKPVNIFRAYLESVIAALSINIPGLKTFPDDADSLLDIATAKASDKACKLIDRHNDVGLKWIHGLFTYCTEGMVACYIGTKSDKKYGEYKVEQTKDETEYHQYERCPNCNYNLDDITIPAELMGKIQQVRDKAEPGSSDEEIDAQNFANSDAVEKGEICPNCNQQIIAQIVQEPLIITKVVGETKEPKSRIDFGIYGGMNIKIPNYARNQEQCPYLIFDEEVNFVDTFDLFDEKEYSHDDLVTMLKGRVGPRSNYEEWVRMSPQYQGEYPKDLVTVKRAWLRPCTFNRFNTADGSEILKKKFPNGVKVTLVNNEIACYGNADLDSDWELLYNPLADNVHFNPLGLFLVSVQELTNDLISLTIQTIEHGIPQTFADPDVLDFDAYRQLETTPGSVIEATPKTGKGIGDAFHEIKTAQLSQEVLPFGEQLQQFGQLVSGATPSIFGGQLEGSNTASEYSMSRAQALQRLGTTWKMFLSWWKNIHGKAVPKFFKLLREDERFVERRTDGSFFNVFIRLSELEGKIGSVELEANENLPVTWSQRRDILIKLTQLANPQILSILGAPENLQQIREYLGLDDFTIPGENDRNRQYEEIKELLASEPLPNPQLQQIQQDPNVQANPELAQQVATQLPPEVPSVDVDEDYDDHEIHFEIVRNWVQSEEGQIAKIDNPNGYKNVLLHGKLHLVLARQEAAAEAASQAAPTRKEDSSNIKDESDVNTVA